MKQPKKPEASIPERDSRQVALGLLARREHSRHELQYKLASRGFEEPEIEDLLSALTAERLLSDGRFAEAYVRSRQQRGMGPLRVRAELRERGVAGELIDDALSRAEDDWLELARAQFHKKFSEGAARDYKARAKQARFLQQRGFSGDIIRSVLDDTDAAD